MSQNTVRVVARLIALPDQVEALKTLLLNLVIPTRQEAGCIKYELLQNKEDPTDFTFVEEWETMAHIENHLANQHIQEAISQLDGLVAAAPDIRSYNLLQ